MNLPLEIQPLFLQADARNQDAFNPAGSGERRQNAAGMSRPQLVDLNTIALKKGLLELKLKLRSIGRVLKLKSGACRGWLGQIRISGVESDADDTTGRQWFEQTGLENGLVAVLE